jgi:hypothetical protein
VERTPVTSSSIAAVGYDSARHLLEVEFVNGSIYEYQGVAAAEHQALMAADSKGRHFNQHIRDRHLHTLVRGGAPTPRG